MRSCATWPRCSSTARPSSGACGSGPSARSTRSTATIRPPRSSPTCCSARPTCRSGSATTLHRNSSNYGRGHHLRRQRNPVCRSAAHLCRGRHRREDGSQTAAVGSAVPPFADCGEYGDIEQGTGRAAACRSGADAGRRRGGDRLGTAHRGWLDAASRLREAQVKAAPQRWRRFRALVHLCVAGLREAG